LSEGGLRVRGFQVLGRRTDARQRHGHVPQDTTRPMWRGNGRACYTQRDPKLGERATPGGRKQESGRPTLGCRASKENTKVLILFLFF